MGIFILNKPAEQKAPLVSDEIINSFRQQQRDSAQGVSYSNVMNARVHTVIQTQNSTTPTVCKAICDSNRLCNGFQMSPDGTCELVSNLNATYSFEDPDWNLYMINAQVKNKGFGEPIVNQSISGSRIGSISSSTTSKEGCADVCAANRSCTAFSVGNYGCSIHTDDAVKIPEQGTNTYRLVDLTLQSSRFS